MDFDIDILGFSDDEIEKINIDEDVKLEFDKESGATGSQLPKIKFGKIEVEITHDELSELMDLYNQYIDSTGSSYGFVRRILGE